MQIGSNLNSYHAQPINKRANSPSFEKKYPFEDVMTIMSGAFAHNMESSLKTTASILKTNVGDITKQTADYFRAKTLLNKKYPELVPYAESFVKALDSINPNHFGISKEQAAKVVDSEAQKYGSKFIDIEV